MGDINPEDQNNGNEDTDNAGGLRAQLEAEKEKNKRLAAENTAFKQEGQLRELGFGHLNQRQRTTLLRDLADEGKELDEESVKAIADDYGWAKPPDNQDQGQQQQQQDKEMEEPEGPLSAIALMQQAGRYSANTEVSDDFSEQMKKTNSKEELRDLIRSKGPRHRIMHEWDVP